jgi:prepilin-type N-terminal cleavage/methylation domain-containing protein
MYISRKFLFNTKDLNQHRGFTLIELLVVIGILAILLAITLIAINPARQFAQANNTQRRSDINTILNAVSQFVVEQEGGLPLGVDTTNKEIAAPASATNVDLCFQLVTKYLAAMPVDPKVNNGTPISPCTASYNTGYYIRVSGPENRVTVSMDPLNVEEGQNISATR